ncbi:hypothetical protein [Nonlabens antarcticus]|uniref:hypothetical protein n=1 Tax=Nonlabens antarcticus TaxID=392714 RepID=UPI001E2EE83D|nr:hypothetical protein [Nonlabens antarcticus]
MKITKLTLALLAGAVAFVSCNDDDSINDGKFDRAELYATSNTSGNITVYDFSDSNEVTTTMLSTPGSTDNEGIFYDEDSDQLIFASRTTKTVNISGDVEDLITGSPATLNSTMSTADLVSPRAVAVNGNFIVVSDNDSNQLFVYQRAGATATLRNTIQVNFSLWEIQFNGNDLYAVVDKTNQLAVFTNFLSNASDQSLPASKTVAFEGIVRTHGFVYNQKDDIMILTDIGAPSGAGSDTDGAFHIIADFTSKFNNVADGAMLSAAGNQVRVEGAATFLGNPISASYDSETNTIFIAERANGGGRILAFDSSVSGNATPAVNNPLPGASTVFFYGND